MATNKSNKLNKSRNLGEPLYDITGEIIGYKQGKKVVWNKDAAELFGDSETILETKGSILSELQSNRLTESSIKVVDEDLDEVT